MIAGAALGALVIMSPKKVLIDMAKLTLLALKGAPYNRLAYEDLLKALYELFMLGRRNGMIALEEHVINPETSAIFLKYPSFIKNHHAVSFLCNGLRPIIDGKIKPDQLKVLMEVEMQSMEAEHNAPINVLTRAADAMPGFGIVAAVLGIVITMGAIDGPASEIGHKVGAALVGTFLGILISYGFLGPLAARLEYFGEIETTFLRSITFGWGWERGCQGRAAHDGWSRRKDTLLGHPCFPVRPARSRTAASPGRAGRAFRRTRTCRE